MSVDRGRCRRDKTNTKSDPVIPSTNRKARFVSARTQNDKVQKRFAMLFDK